MPKDTTYRLLVDNNDPQTKRKLRRYQITWNPAFTSSTSRAYIIGEDTNEQKLSPSFAGVQELVDLGLTNSLILPLNTNIALAQNYSPSIKNKIVKYETLGGNSISTFGEAIRTIALRIRLIKLSGHWEVYYKALEAISYLSANQSRYYGALYLASHDSFGDTIRQDTNSFRYKVTVESLNFDFKSDSNTTVTADLSLIVNRDLSRSSRRNWGRL